MRTHIVRTSIPIALVACAVSGSMRQVPRTGGDAPAPLYPVTVAAPSGSALRVFVEPTKVIGWIAGSKSYAGASATLKVAGERELRTLEVGDDNTFAFAVSPGAAREATISVGDLVQKVTLQPPPTLEPAAYLITDRNAYRPGQTLAFTAFLRRLDADGVFRAEHAGPVEVRVVSDTKKSVAAKLKLPVDAGGRIYGEYTFSPADPLDSYTVSITGYRGETKVTLAEYRKAKVGLEVDAVLGERAADLTFAAKDFMGKPVPGGAVTFTAQVVYEPEQAASLSATDFVYGGSPGLRRDETLLHAADPDTAGRLWETTRHAVSESAGKIELDARGSARFKVPLESAYLRGHHRLLVDALIVDAAGREQRTTRSIPLSRSEIRLQIVSPHELVATDGTLDVSVRAVDGSGRLVVPASASVAAIRIDPPVQLGNYYGNNWNGNLWNNGGNGRWVGGPNGGHWVGGPNGGVILNNDDCVMTNNGCITFGRAQRVPRNAPVVGTGELAATAAVIGERASLPIGDPGAYKLIASAKLADGSTVWGEAGVAVREREAMPDLVLELDRKELDRGDAIAGTLQSKYRDAAALVMVRDASGVKARHRVTLADGRARLAIPITDNLGYGAAVEAYVLGEGGVQAAQQLVHVQPTHKQLAIKTELRSSYGPGDVVDLGIDVDRADGPVDLVVSVFDQSLLGTAPDRAIDPRGFFLGDDRVRSRAALATIAAQLGDITIGAALDRARALAKTDRSFDVEHERKRALASQLISMLGSNQAITGHTAVALLRFLGVKATGGHASSDWTDPEFSSGVLAHMRVIDLLGNLKYMAFERVADAIAVYDPRHEPLRTEAVSFGGNVSGNASFSVGNVGHGFSRMEVPAGPALLSVAGDATGTVRRDFSDSAFWSSTLRTDGAGKARVKFKLPDSLTNWQVVVTAIGGDKVGRHTAKLKTVRDIMIWPLLPRQLVEGDVVEIGASVHNLTDSDREITVALDSKQAALLTPARLTVHVPRNGTVPVSWRVRAGEPGFATLLASASTPGAPPDASLKKLPIVPSSAEQVITASGFADKPLTIELPPGVDPRRARLELTFAPSLAADMADTLDYLVEYPYGCAEQTMSRFAPAIEVVGVLDNLGIKNGGLAARLPRVIDGGLKRLAELQQPDGGWAWNGHAQTHEMITPYVVWGLLRAERAGYKPADPTSIERGLARIRELVQARGDDQLSDRTYLMYVYAQKHPLPDQWWDWLVTRAPKLSDYALALAVQIAIVRKERAIADQLATQLRARAVRDNTGTHWRTGSFSRWMEDPFETSAVALDALVAHDANDPMLPEVLSYFITNKRGDRWNSTKDTAMILYAMTRYLRARNIAADRTAVVDVSVDGKPAKKLAFGDGLVRDLRIGGSQLSPRTTVTFANASPGMMVRAVLHYRTSGRNLAPVANGLAVQRTLYLLGPGGKRIKPLAPGDKVPRGAYVESVVKVDHAQREVMRYLLIEDPKPAGAEALPVDDKRFPRYPRPYVLREDRETHLAFHHEQTPATTEVHTILHLESSGDLAFVPASAELMYQTQTRGHSGSFGLRVE